MLQTFAGGRLFGRSTGSEPRRVLALHGWARNHRDFDAVLVPSGADPLAAIALDLPGFGATPAPPEPWGSAQYASCVADVLDEMDDSVVVLGHSFGGRVAVQLANQRPDRVRGLVLSAVPLVLAKAPVRRSALRFRLVRRLHRAGLLSDVRLEAARLRHGSADYRAAQGVMREVLVKSVGERYGEQLDGIACPVALVWGDDDTETPLPLAQVAAQRMAKATLTVCPGAGHLTPLTVPGALRAAVIDCLN